MGKKFARIFRVRNQMKKDDELGDAQNIYQNLDKSTVLQEARVFNETPIRAGRCCLTLTKVLYLLYQGEHLQPTEATELFFQVTKLFQSKDTQLRRLVYLVIKELSTVANDVIMATSSLTKDMNDRMASEIGYRANALRALVKIIDPSMVQAIERFIKQAIVDKDPSVTSAALVSAIHLFQQGNKEVVKRWVNEVQEAVKRTNGLLQYHSLGLMYQIKQNDKMAVAKLIQQLLRGNTLLLRSELSYCMVIRCAYRVIEDDGGLEGPSRGLFEILENCLRHRHEMVNLEAARAICSLRGVTVREIFPATSVLQLFLNSPKPTLRFAAIRTLNKLAMTHPDAVTPCNLDIENLIADANRGVATFAITTLLKTGNEASVDRLMKQLSGFMSEISDEFRVIVVDAIRALCLKFPTKHAMMLQFLSNALRDEGGYEFKRAIVEGIFDVISVIPEAKEAALSHLCEYIEDCEFTRLAVRILHLLGEEGPKMQHPTKYIRHIYNRTILENAPVRAAATSALAKFATVLGGDIKDKVITLLNRCLDDPDDEVRDRAVMYLKLLTTERESNDGLPSITDDSTFVFENLEQQLVNYIADQNALLQPFDMKTVPLITKAQEDAVKQRSRNAQSQFAQAAGLAPQTPKSDTSIKGAAAAVQTVGGYKDAAIEAMPEFSSFGPLFRSSTRVELTETDVAEYVVSCTKHMFKEHIVFQFLCRNTLDDVLLEDVTVLMESDDPDLTENLTPVGAINISKLPFDQPASAFVIFKKNAGPSSVPMGTYTTTLKFVSKDCDPQTGVPDEEGFDDTYQMDELELLIGDYLVPSYAPNFAKLWDQLGEPHEIVETFQLGSVANIKEAVEAVSDVLGMSACDNSDQFGRDKAVETILNHTLLLSGVFVGGVRCACRVRMACVSGQSGVTMEMTVRSERDDVSQLISESIG